MAEAGDFAGEWGGEGGGTGDEAGDAAGLGVVAGGPDEAFGLAGGDEGAGEGDVAAVCEGGFGWEGVVVFVCGEGFAGEGGFVAAEVVGDEEAEVRGDAVAGLEEDEVAGDDVCGGEADFFSAAADGGFGEDEAVEGVDGFFGFGFLEVADDGVCEDDGEDDAAIDPFVEVCGDGDGGEEDVDEGLVELEEEALPCGGAAACGHGVWAEVGEAVGGVLGIEASGWVCLEEACGFRVVEVMPLG